jgi:hypothetical protein
MSGVAIRWYSGAGIGQSRVDELPDNSLGTQGGAELKGTDQQQTN